jgi:YggT family protein
MGGQIYVLVCVVLNLYALALFVWVIFSWVRISSTHPLAKLQLMLDRIIYPVILPIRRFVPPLRLGGVAIDLSVILLFILIRVIC